MFKKCNVCDILFDEEECPLCWAQREIVRLRERLEITKREEYVSAINLDKNIERLNVLTCGLRHALKTSKDYREFADKMQEVLK